MPIIPSTEMIWGALMPGIRKWVSDFGCEFYYDGFVPACRCDDKTIQIDMGKVEDSCRRDVYSEIKEYIQELTSEIKEVV